MKKYKNRLFEDIKYYFHLYNYDESIKIEGIEYILNFIQSKGYNFPEKSLIDLGGGNGLYSYRLKKRGLKTSITIVDKHVTPVFSFKHISEEIESLTEVEKYDIVCCLLVLELVSDRLVILQKINNLLKKNGIAFISIPNIKGANVQMWRDNAKESKSELSQLFYKNQKLFSIDTLNKELLLFNLEIIDKYEYGFLPVYATNSQRRIMTECYSVLNNRLKGYFQPSYHLFVVRKILK